MNARTLRWPTESALARCAGQIAAACAAWAQAWTGQALEAEVQPGSAPGWPQRSLALATGERVALAGADLAALFAAGDAAAGSAATPDGPSITQEACAAAEIDLLERLFAAVVSSMTGDAAPLPDRPDAQQGLPHAGAASFEAWLAGRACVHVQVSGEALARLAPQPPRTLKPLPLEAAAVRGLASHSRVRGCLKLADLHLPLGALMQAEVGDVIVLDRKLDALFEWEVEAIGLRLPAQLVRTGDNLAAELL